MHVHCIGCPTHIHLLSFLLQLFLCIVLHLEKLFLYRNSHINNFVCVLILVNPDVLGLLVDLLLSDWFRFSA